MLSRMSADIGPALPRPNYARSEAREEMPLGLMAIVPHVKVMAVVMAETMHAAARVAAVSPACGCVARRYERGSERNGGGD